MGEQEEEIVILGAKEFHFDQVDVSRRVAKTTEGGARIRPDTLTEKEPPDP